METTALLIWPWLAEFFIFLHSQSQTTQTKPVVYKVVSSLGRDASYDQDPPDAPSSFLSSPEEPTKIKLRIIREIRKTTHNLGLTNRRKWCNDNESGDDRADEMLMIECNDGQNC
jgi:hypothetical protein